jgi:1-acyl-sn-glycerol-3-phosphate acyltransferase
VTVPPRTVRRLLLPLSLAVVGVLAGVSVAAAVIGALLVPFDRRCRILRTSSFAFIYCAVEVAAIAAAAAVWGRRRVHKVIRPSRSGDWSAVNERLLHFLLRTVLRASRRCFGFRVELDKRSVPGPLEDPQPALVLARHGGPGDSFALAYLLTSLTDKRLRIVAKDVLQLDPAIDILLNRTGSCFLRPGRAAVADLRKLIATIGPGDVILLFPEGSNWTPQRRSRAIGHLRRQKRSDAVRAAELMSHVLPARPTGVLAFLESRPDLPVVIAAHAGLDKVVSLPDAWAAIPVREAMRVRLWPATPAPAERHARLAWLRSEWAVVDEWVDAHHSGAS